MELHRANGFVSSGTHKKKAILDWNIQLNVVRSLIGIFTCRAKALHINYSQNKLSKWEKPHKKESFFC